MLKSFLKKLANRFGYDILHLPTDPMVRRRLDLLRKYNIDLIFDVGANTGQFAGNLRKLGYKGQIVSFEPLPDAFRKLKSTAIADPCREAVNIAVGNFDGETEINISENSYSSSIKEMLPVHLESAPESKFIAKIKVQVKKIDSFINNYYKEGDNLLLKIDTQGFEKEVFEGCLNSLDKIKGFQMELSLVELYKGETLFQPMVDLLRKHGYKLMLIESGHKNYETGELLQVEGIFFS